LYQECYWVTCAHTHTHTQPQLRCGTDRSVAWG